MPTISLEQEIERRHNATEHLIEFTKFLDPTYVAEPIHYLMAQTVEDVLLDRIPGIRGGIITVPPQIGKSRLCSVDAPAWMLGKFPNRSGIITSYGAHLAQNKSFQVRETISSNEYGYLFPNSKVHPKLGAVEQWRLDEPNKASIVAAGVSGPITGFPANWAIIDDPYKDWQEAQSELVRKRVREWFKSTLRSRMHAGAKLLMPMTRWHIDDIAGTLIPTGRYIVLRVPAIAESQKERDKINEKLGLGVGLPDPLGREEGESIAPIRFPVQDLLEKKEDMGSLVFNALYQGAPTGVSSGFINEASFVRTNTVPPDILQNSLKVRYWDKAGTQDGGKFTASIMMQMHRPTQSFWIDSNDIKHFQFNASRRELAIREMAELDRAKYNNEVVTYVEQEPASGGKESAENTLANLSEFDVHIDPVKANKDVRWAPFSAKVEQRKVHVTYGPLGDKLIEESLEVPTGRFRDLTDAAAGAYAKLIKLSETKTHIATSVVQRNNQMLGVQQYLRNMRLGRLTTR